MIKMAIAAVLAVISLFSIAMLMAAMIYLNSLFDLSLLGALAANLCALICFGLFMLNSAQINLVQHSQKIWPTFYARIFGQSLESFLATPVERMISLRYNLEHELKNHSDRLSYILIIIALIILSVVFFMFIFWPIAVLLCLISFIVFMLRIYIKNICDQFDNKLEKLSLERWQMLSAVQASFNMWASLGDQKALIAKLFDNNHDITKLRAKKMQFLALLSALKLVLPLLIVIILSVGLYQAQVEISRLWLIFFGIDALGLGLAWAYLLIYYDFSFSKLSFKNLPVKPESGHVMPVNIAGRIEVLELSFSYNDSSVLVINNMSLLIEAGGLYSLVGVSGSGKSTLLKILMAQLFASRGQVVFDGQDIRSLELDSLRSHFGVVSQDSRLFAGSIYDNILCGRKISPRRIEDLLYSHEIFDLVLDLPMGLQSQIFLAAPNLSRSQVVVILLARALVHQPKILFLDEIFKGMSKSEQILIGDYLSSLSISRIMAVHQELSHLKSQAIYL